jgi:hypothetical protein
MVIVMNDLKGLSNVPDALRLLMLGLLAAIITGVLTSPPAAVHGINHDYHAVWQQRVNKQKSTLVHNAPSCFTWAVLSISFGSWLKEKGSDLPGADIRFPVLAIIQACRLLL